MNVLPKSMPMTDAWTRAGSQSSTANDTARGPTMAAIEPEGSKEEGFGR